MSTRRCLAILVTLGALCAPALAGEADSPRVGLKVLPFTGLVWPHQQLAGSHPAPPLGVGLEVYYTPRFSLALDLSTSWHGGDDLAQFSSLQVLGRWWFPGETWSPFLQAGVGGYQAELDEGARETQYGGGGLSFGGGVEVPLRDRFFLQGELRSNWAQGETSDGGRELWIVHTQALVWVGYKLP